MVVLPESGGVYWCANCSPFPSLYSAIGKIAWWLVAFVRRMVESSDFLAHLMDFHGFCQTSSFLGFWWSDGVYIFLSAAFCAEKSLLKFLRISALFHKKKPPGVWSLPDGSSAPFCLFLRWSAVSD